MSRSTNDIQNFIAEFPNQVFNYYVHQKDVINYLKIADYGVLIRDQSDTNKVAAPVKFAEYLYAGLEVIISENLGDYENFVKINNCGIVYSSSINVEPIKLEKKKLLNKLANDCFTKKALEEKYGKLIQVFQSSILICK